MEVDPDLFILCEHGFEPGECSDCDDASAHTDRPIERLRKYLAEHPELVDAAPDRLQGLPLN